MKKFLVIGIVAAASAFGLAGCGSALGPVGEVDGTGQIVSPKDSGAQTAPTEASDVIVAGHDGSPNAAPSTEPEITAAQNGPTAARPAFAAESPKYEGLKPAEARPEIKADLSKSLAALSQPLEIQEIDFINSAVIRLDFDRAFSQEKSGTVRLDAYTVFHKYVPAETKEYVYAGSIPGSIQKVDSDSVFFHPASPLKGVTNLMAGEKTETTTITYNSTPPQLAQQNASPGAFSTSPGGSSGGSGQQTTVVLTNTTPITVVGAEGLNPSLCNSSTHCEAVIYVLRASGFEPVMGKAMKEHSEALVRCVGGNSCLPCADDDDECEALNGQLN